MKRKKVWTLVLLTIFTFPFLGLATESSNTFLPRNKDRGAMEAFMALYSSQSKASVLFFDYSKTHKGVSKEQAKKLMKEGQFTLARCGTLTLRTARIVEGKLVFWRNVKKDEPTVSLLLPTENGTMCIPYFLPECGNPVDGVRPKKKVVHNIVEESCCDCFPIGPTITTMSVSDSVYFKVGIITVEEKSIDTGTFTPMYCPKQ